MKLFNLLKHATACGILSAALLAQANTDFYLTTSGIDGTGTGSSADPFVAASTNSYNWVLTNKQPNYTIIYEPGIYRTWGGPSIRAVGDGCIHRGATNGTTTIRYVNQYTNTQDNYIFTSRLPNTTGSGQEDLPVNSFQLYNLVLDCDANNQTQFMSGTPGKWGGAWIGGNNIICSNVTFIGFGALCVSGNADGMESFPFVYHTGSTNGNTNVPATSFGNVRVDRCTFTSPATNNTGTITCCVIVNNQVNGARLSLTNTVVTNCNVLNVGPAYSGLHNVNAFNAPRVENCLVSGCDTGIYIEAGGGDLYDYYDGVYVANNILTNVQNGLLISCVGDPVVSLPLRNIRFISNQIYATTNTWLDTIAVYCYGSNYPSISDLTITDNSIQFNDSQLHPSNYRFGLHIANVTNLYAAYNSINLGCDRDLVVYTNSVQSFSFLENRNSTNFLLPIRESSANAVIATQQKGDFNLDGKPDIIFHNKSTGANLIWFMGSTNGSYAATNVISTCNITNAGAAWWPEGTADFNGDGVNDFIVRNRTTGSNVCWIMGGSGTDKTNVVQVQNLPTMATNWFLVGVGDFNGDGKYDVVWRDQGHGTNLVWIMNGLTNVVTTNYLPSQTTIAWKICGAGDFNQDGSPDLVWHNTATGANAVWFMDGTSFLSGVSLLTVTDLSWALSGVADVDMDSKPDLVWRYYGTASTTGANSFWLMGGTNGTTRTGTSTTSVLADTNYYIVGH